DVAPQSADLGGGGRADHADAAAHGAHRSAAFADAAPARAGAGRLRPAPTRRVLGAAPAWRGSAVAGRGQSDGRRGGRRKSPGEGGPRNGSRPDRGAGVAGMEPVFRTLEIAAESAMRATGTHITYRG